MKSIKKLLQALITPLPLDIYPKIVSLVWVLIALPVSIQLLGISSHPNSQAAAIASRFIPTDLSPIYFAIGGFILAVSLLLYFLKRAFDR